MTVMQEQDLLEYVRSKPGVFQDEIAHYALTKQGLKISQATVTVCHGH